MMMVLLALLMGLGVLFGSQALVVDLGYSMVKQGAMQNAADAGAMAAGKLMAGEVALDTSNKAVYQLSDNQTHRQVASRMVDNWPGTVRMDRDPGDGDAYPLNTTWLNTSTYTEFELNSRPVATWQIMSQPPVGVRTNRDPNANDTTYP